MFSFVSESIYCWIRDWNVDPWNQINGYGTQLNLPKRIAYIQSSANIETIAPFVLWHAKLSFIIIPPIDVAKVDRV